jgi:hypothetical protein
MANTILQLACEVNGDPVMADVSEGAMAGKPENEMTKDTKNTPRHPTHPGFLVGCALSVSFVVQLFRS